MAIETLGAGGEASVGNPYDVVFAAAGELATRGLAPLDVKEHAAPVTSTAEDSRDTFTCGATNNTCITCRETDCVTCNCR